MTLFLQGRSGVGKSRLLQETLAPYVKEIAGFTVQRLKINGAAAGFRVVNIENGFAPLEAVYAPEMTGVFIFRGRRDVFALEEAILRLEEESCGPQCKLVLLDEIGGIELSSRIFMDALKRIISSDKPCCGVFKSFENLIHTASKLKLKKEYAEYHRELASLLEEKGELLTVTEQNYLSLRDYLSASFRPVFL